MVRRRLDADTRWRIMQVEAWRHIGRRHAYAIAFGPYIGRAVLLLAAAVGLMVAWMRIPHLYLGVGALIVAVVLGGGWLLYTGSNRALQRRMQSRTGKAGRGAGLGWAVASVVALLGVTGWVSLWSPWA